MIGRSAGYPSLPLYHPASAFRETPFAMLQSVSTISHPNGKSDDPMSDETITLELAAMAHGGNALGRHENRAIFVPYTIPGEIIEARITQDKGRIAFAEGIKLLNASADRVFPRCPHFGPHKCGRCQWQHINYAAQLLLKQDVLADQLARVGGFDDADVQPVIPSPQQWGYNYHMTLQAGHNGVLGFPGADEGVLYPLEECHILHPDLVALYEQLDLDFTQPAILPDQLLKLGTVDGQHPVLDRRLIPESNTLDVDGP